MLVEEPLQQKEKIEMRNLVEESFFYGRKFSDPLAGGNAVGSVFAAIAEAIMDATNMAELDIALAEKAKEIKEAIRIDKESVEAELVRGLADSLSETCRKTFCRMRGLKESDVFGKDEHIAEVTQLFGERPRPTIH